MFAHIDQSSQIPIYRQLRDQIVAGIASGELSPGDQLPSVRALGTDLGINLHTVNKAYAVLRDEGYLVMRSRAGARVAAPAGNAAAARRLADSLSLLVAEFKAAGGTREMFEQVAAAELDRAFNGDAASRHTDAARIERIDRHE